MKRRSWPVRHTARLLRGARPRRGCLTPRRPSMNGWHAEGALRILGFAWTRGSRDKGKPTERSFQVGRIDTTSVAILLA